MNYTDEMIARAKKASSASELQAMAKENNIELSEAEAAEYFDFLNGIHKVNENGLQELSTVELEMVAGGKGQTNPDPKYQVGQTVWIGYPTSQSFVRATILEQQFYHGDFNSWRYLLMNERNLEIEEYLDSHPYIQTTDPTGKKWPY